MRWDRHHPIKMIKFVTFSNTFLKLNLFWRDAQCKIVSIRARKTLFFVISDRFNGEIHLVDKQT